MRHSRRRFVGLLASTPLALALGACLGEERPQVTVTIDGGSPAPTRTTTPAPTLTASALPFTPVAPASDLDPEDLRGFVMPIGGACYPGNDASMPGAVEEGAPVNEGVDFYFGDSCVVIDRGTPVVAAYGGVVVRADHTYLDLTLNAANELRTALGEEEVDDEALDTWRGRQLWIDHGKGVVTRYCHLHRIEPDLAEGVLVEQGQVIASIGESGLPESVTAPGMRLHLHWEVRVGAGYLGQGLEPEDVRALYQRLVSPS